MAYSTGWGHRETIWTSEAIAVAAVGDGECNELQPYYWLLMRIASIGAARADCLDADRWS